MIRLKKLLTTIILLFLTLSTTAEVINKDQISASYSRDIDNNLSLNIYFGERTREKNRHAYYSSNFEFGYFFHQNKTNFLGVNTLKYYSHSLYAGVNRIFFDRVYVGGFLGFSGNWVSKESKAYFRNNTSLNKHPIYFGGILFGVKAGVVQKLMNNLYLNIHSQVGANWFEVGEGVVSSLIDDDEEIYTEVKLNYFINFGAGLIFEF